MALRSLVSAALTVSVVLGATIDHDAVVGFDEAVPDSSEGDLMLAYKPYLKVFNGCVPFPAVDADGNTRYAVALSFLFFLFQRAHFLSELVIN